MKPPVAEKHRCELEIHGKKIVDNYKWLKADNWREIMRQPESVPDNIKKYLDQENKYCNAILKKDEDTKNIIFEEMKNRIKQDDSSVPVVDGEFEYQTRYEKNQEYPLYIRMPKNTEEETILFDGPKEAKGFEYFDVRNIRHSPDHSRISWSVDNNGAEYYMLKIQEVGSGRIVDEVTDVGTFAWGKDSETIVYVKVDENHRPHKVVVRTPDKLENVIFTELDPRFFVSVSKSLDGETIIINSSMNDEYENMFVKADTPNMKPIMIAEREEKHEYEVEIENNKIFVLTNWNAPNYRIMCTNIDKPNKENWTEWCGHREDVMITGFFLIKNYLIRMEKENALPRIVVTNLENMKEEIVQFDEEAYAVSISRGMEYDTSTFRFGYSSPATPSQIWDYDISTQNRKLRKEQEIPSGHNPDNYIVRRLYAPAHDGETIPISLVYHKDTKIDGNAPCLLYGYGSYGMGMDAGFNSNRLSLVDRGFVYAVAHIRGGDEKGREWYEQTRKSGKTKTFLDFISCGKYLVDEKFTGS